MPERDSVSLTPDTINDRTPRSGNAAGYVFASDETSVENTIGDGAHHELTRNTYDLYGQWTTKRSQTTRRPR